MQQSNDSLKRGQLLETKEHKLFKETISTDANIILKTCKNKSVCMVNCKLNLIDKDEGTKKRSYSSRSKASEEDEEHSWHKRQKLRNNSYRDKSEI